MAANRCITKYIQAAVLQIFCKDYTENDKIFIFATKKAKEMHIEPQGGLKDEIQRLGGLKADFQVIEIPDGKQESELWDIFTEVFEKLDRDTKITFDATHGFRSLPIFGMTVLNYSHYLKNTALEGIYYGAFEAGDGKKEDGHVPIFNITSAYDLMSWTTAANSFTKYGITDELCERIQWNKEQIESARSLSKAIKDMEMTLNYMRGSQIVSGEVFDNCREKIEQYKKSESFNSIPVLSDILDKVNEKISEFSPNSSLNFVYAVQWYIDHSMPGEALSMLKEGAITYLLEKNGLEWNDKNLRMTFGKRLGFKEVKNEKYQRLFEYNEKEEKYKEVVEQLISKQETQRLKTVVEKINTCRNDIDHCGFEKENTPGIFDHKIKEAFEEVLNIFGIKHTAKNNVKDKTSVEREETLYRRTPAVQPNNLVQPSSPVQPASSEVKSGNGGSVAKTAAKQSTGCAVIFFGAVIAALSLLSVSLFL